MPDLSLPNTIDANTTADAIEVEQNFQVLRQFINADLINRDGSVAMTQQLVLAGNPTSELHAAPKEYVDALLPIGIMLPYCGGSAPVGQWALCNGASLPVASYPRLHSVLGFRYGGGGGSFNIPNMAARVPVGVDSGQTRFDTTGKTGGSTTVPVPAHTHTINHDHGSITSGNQSANHTHAISGTTSSAGTHNHAADGAATHYLTIGTGTGGWGPTPANFGGTATTEDGGAHTHTFADTSGNNSVSHNHAVNLPAYSGASGSYSKEVTIDADPLTKTTTELVPPYVVVAYIIRVDQT